MSTSEAVKTRLDEIHAVYLEIEKLKQRLTDLQTVEQARAEYEKLVATEESKLTNLEQQKRKLEDDLRSLTVRKQPLGRPRSVPKPTNLPPPKIPSSHEKSDEPTKKKPGTEAREKLKRLLNRYYRFQLDASVLGQINRIAEDVERPLGEALALLDWSIFEDYASDASHLEQLNQWGDELQEYRQYLSGEVDMLELRFRDYLGGIWERWRTRDQSPENLLAWQTFITETQLAKQAEAAKLEEDIRQIKEKIAQIRVDVNQPAT